MNVLSQGGIHLENYEDFVAALKARANQLGVSYEHIDELAGFSPGYTGKVFGGSQTKKFGWLTAWLIAPALAYKIVLVEDPEAFQKRREQYGQRRANQAREGNHASNISKHVLKRVYRHIMQSARSKRWHLKSKADRVSHARMMARARWKKKRVQGRR